MLSIAKKLRYSNACMYGELMLWHWFGFWFSFLGYHLQEINIQMVCWILFSTHSSSNYPGEPEGIFNLNSNTAALRQFISIAGILGVVKSDALLHLFGMRLKIQIITFGFISLEETQMIWIWIFGGVRRNGTTTHRQTLYMQKQ